MLTCTKESKYPSMYIGIMLTATAWKRNKVWTTTLKNKSAISLLKLCMNVGLPLLYLYAESAMSWNQRLFTTLLIKKRGMTQQVLKISERNGFIQYQTVSPVVEFSPKTILRSRLMNGRRRYSKNQMLVTKRPPFNRPHCMVLLSTLDSLWKEKMLTV